MSIPPAVHGQDVSCGFLMASWYRFLTRSDYFFVDNETTPVSNVALAKSIQHDLIRFVAGEELGSKWPAYGKQLRLNNVTASTYKPSRLDPDQARRCELLYDIFVDPKNGA